MEFLLAIEHLHMSETITGINLNSEVKHLKVFEPIIRLTAQVHVPLCRSTEVPLCQNTFSPAHSTS